MAASTFLSGSTGTYDRGTAYTSAVRTYNWPPIALNLWIFTMLLASGSIMGVFSIFIQTQERLLLGIPWYFPYFITVSAITATFIFVLFWLIYNRRLLPGIVMIGAFILFILWLVGLIVVATELFGPNGSVNSVCERLVFSKNPTGQTIETLAWLQQKNICETWRLVFAMALIGVIFLVWIMILAYKVFVKS